MCWMWCCKDAFRPLAYWHNWHLNGFSPVCTIICLFIVPFCDIITGQKGHWYFPTPSFMGSFCKKSRKNFYLPNECIFSKYNVMCIFHMWAKIWISIGRVLAELTRKWFLSCMYHDMPFDALCIFHYLRTEWTPILSCAKFYGIILQKKVDKTFICKMFINKQL